MTNDKNKELSKEELARIQGGQQDIAGHDDQTDPPGVEPPGGGSEPNKPKRAGVKGSFGESGTVGGSS